MRINFAIIYYILLYALISSIGLYLIKKQLNTVTDINLRTSIALLRNFEFLFGFLMYLGGFVYWFVILHKFNLSLAFPIAATSLMIMTTLFSVFFLKEQLAYYNWVGFALMMIGIMLVSYRKG